MVLRMSAGTCMKGADFYLVPDDITDEQLADAAWQEAVEFASSYGKYPESALEDMSEEEYAELSESDLDSYTGDIWGSFENYDPKKHDGLVTGFDTEPRWSNY